MRRLGYAAGLTSLVLCALLSAGCGRDSGPQVTQLRVVPGVDSQLSFQDGSLHLSWKAPAVSAGTAASDIRYTAACGRVTKTVATTSVALTNVASSPQTVHCSVVAKVGSVVGLPVDAKPIVAYQALTGFVVTYDAKTAKAIRSHLRAIWPGVSSSDVGLQWPQVAKRLDGTASRYAIAGSASVGNRKVVDLHLVRSADSTDAHPASIVVGFDASKARTAIVECSNYDAQTGTDTATIPSDPSAISWWDAAGLKVVPGQHVGTCALWPLH
jgi:hypothetical protein